MPRTCTICRHPQKAEIDEALLAGTPFRNIAKRYGTSSAALVRHKSKDLPAALVKAKQVSEEVSAESLYDRLHAINRETAMIPLFGRQTLLAEASSFWEVYHELEQKISGGSA